MKTYTVETETSIEEVVAAGVEFTDMGVKFNGVNYELVAYFPHGQILSIIQVPAGEKKET